MTHQALLAALRAAAEAASRPDREWRQSLLEARYFLCSVRTSGLHHLSPWQREQLERILESFPTLPPRRLRGSDPASVPAMSEMQATEFAARIILLARQLGGEQAVLG